MVVCVDLNADNVTVFSSGCWSILVLYTGLKKNVDERLEKARSKPSVSERAHAVYRVRKNYDRVEKKYKKLVAARIVEYAFNCGDTVIVMENLFWAKKAYPGTYWRWIPTSWQWYIEKEAENNGLQTVFVSPAGTSKHCPVCGGYMKKRRNRKLYCPTCNLLLDRDVVAVLNLYRRHTGNSISIDDVRRLSYRYEKIKP